MIPAWQLMANARPPAAHRVWLDGRMLWAAIALVGLILLGAIVIALLDRWRKRPLPQTSDTNDQLAQFRELYEAGELSQAEFDRIREKLTGQLRKELDIPVVNEAKEPPAPPQPPEGTKPETPSP